MEYMYSWNGLSQIMFETRCNLNVEDRIRTTPLHHAARNGHMGKKYITCYVCVQAHTYTRTHTRAKMCLFNGLIVLGHPTGLAPFPGCLATLLSSFVPAWLCGVMGSLNTKLFFTVWPLFDCCPFTRWLAVAFNTRSYDQMVQTYNLLPTILRYMLYNFVKNLRLPKNKAIILMCSSQKGLGSSGITHKRMHDSR